MRRESAGAFAARFAVLGFTHSPRTRTRGSAVFSPKPPNRRELTNDVVPSETVFCTSSCAAQTVVPTASVIVSPITNP